jgi:hypothetical protein
MKKLSLLVLFLIGMIQTNHAMLETFKTCNPFNSLLDHKTTALVAGMGILGTAVLGYTSYSLWQNNKNLRHNLSEKSKRIYILEDDAINKDDTAALHNNLFAKALEKALQENSYYRQKLAHLEIDKNSNQRTIYNLTRTLAGKDNVIADALAQKDRQREEIEQFMHILNKKRMKKEKKSSTRDKGKEKINTQNSDHKEEILFSSFLDVHAQREALEKQFEELPISDNDSEIPLVITNNNESIEGPSSESMNQSITLENDKPLFTNTEKFSNYRFDTIRVQYVKEETEKTIPLITVHGTFVNSDEFGAQKKEEISQSIINFAKKLARDKKCNVCIIPFNWSGDVREEYRTDAADVLATIIQTHCSPDQEIWTIAHSHGGNVVLKAAQKLKKWGSLGFAINIGMPTEDGFNEKVKTSSRVVKNSHDDYNIKNLFNIYSTGDVTQNIGSQLSTSWIPGLGNFERRVDFKINDHCKVWNIRTQIDGDEPNHLNIISPVIKYLHTLIPLIKTHYAFIHDLDANLTPKHELPQVAIRNLIRSEGLPGGELSKAVNHSDHASKKFEADYGRNIKDKTKYGVVKICGEINDGFKIVAGKLFTMETVRNNLQSFKFFLGISS